MVPSSPFFPVEGGENHIHMDGFGLAVPQGHQPVDRGVGGEEGGGNGALLPGAGEDVLHRAGVQQPAPLFGDAHHVHLVSFVGEVLQDGSDGHPGDFMLGGDAPENHSQAQLGAFVHCNHTPCVSKKFFQLSFPKGAGWRKGRIRIHIILCPRGFRNPSRGGKGISPRRAGPAALMAQKRIDFSPAPCYNTPQI